MKKNKIIIFGASGFIGQHLCELLLKNKFKIIALVREKNSVVSQKLLKLGAEVDYTGDLISNKKIFKKYSDISVIINLAALAHINIKNISEKILIKQNEIEKNIVKSFSNKNIRVIHLSSAKVKDIKKNNLFNSPYEKVKFNSEIIIRKKYKNHIILRPPLVYGPQVKANFLYLIKAIYYNIPLPFKNIHNKRSYIYIENLTDAILHIIKKNYFNGQTYYISDNFSISTPKLCILIAKNLNRKLILFYFPLILIKLLLNLLGRPDIFNKTIENFIVDGQKFINDTNWTPPISAMEGIKKTCLWYKRRFNIK